MNQFTRPLVLVILVIIFSFLLFYIPQNTTVFNYNIKKTDILIDIKPDSLIDLELQTLPYEDELFDD